MSHLTHDKEIGLESVERSSPVVRPTRGSKAKNHCARCWWLYLIVFIIVALAVVLGIIFGALPKIGQKTINQSTLTVDSIVILQPEDDKFTFGLNATVRGHVPVTSHLNPQRLSMFLVREDGTEGKPFMYLNLTRLNLKDVFSINVTDYPMEVADKDAFAEFTAVALASETLKMGVRSRPVLYVGSLHNRIDYHKIVEVKGFNKLNGVKLSNPRLVSPAEEDGTNMLTDCNIPNPSPFTLEMGNLTMNFEVGGMKLGFGVVQNLILRPGDNSMTVRAHLPPALTSSSILLNATLSSGAPITLSGNSTVYNGNHISWLEKPLGSLSLNVSSPGALVSS